MAGTVLLLQQGLKKRFESKRKLKDKLALAVNVTTTDIAIRGKERIVLNWFISTLEAKYQENSWKASELSKFWTSFLSVLRHVERNQTTVVSNADFLLNIFDSLDLQNTVILQSLEILLRLLSKIGDEGKILELVAKLSGCDVGEELASLMIEILENRTSQLNFSDRHLCETLANLSKISHVKENDLLLGILRKVLFPQLDGFTAFVSTVESTDQGKYTPSPEVERFTEYVRIGGNLSSLVKSVPSQAQWLKGKLFCLLLQVQGHATIAKESVLLAQLTRKPDPSDLYAFISASLPLDVTQEVSEGLTIGKQLQEFVKQSLETSGLDKNTVSMILSLYVHHPLQLDSLVSQILVTYLHSSEAPAEVFTTVIELALKLRQLPKLISKLFLQLRTCKRNSDIRWRKKDLEIFGEAVANVPRVQSTLIWKSILYHLATDCIPNLPDGTGTLFWRTAAPLLTTVFSYAQLSDHNVPEPLSVRVKDLVQSTLTDVFLKLDGIKFEQFDRCLYASLVLNFLGLVDLMSSFRNTRYDGVEEFHAATIEQALVSRDFPSYSDLLLPALRSDSKYVQKVWEIFHEDIIQNQQYLCQVFDLIPSEYLCHVTDLDGAEELKGNAAYAALVLSVEFTKLRKVKCLIPAARMDLWSDAAGWNSLQSELGKVLQTSIQQTEQFVQGSVESVNLDRLNKIPLEALPRVMKLGSSLIGMYYLFSMKNRVELSVSDLLMRCFEDTDVFRYIDSGVFIDRLLSLTLPDLKLLDVIAVEVVKYRKMISEIAASFDVLRDRLTRGEDNTVYFLLSLLDQLSRPLADLTVAEPKKSAVLDLVQLISKCFIKHLKSDLIRSSETLGRCACILVKQRTLPSNKLEKFVRKVLDVGLRDGCLSSLALVDEIRRSEDFADWATEDDLTLVQNIALDNLDSEEAACRLPSLVSTCGASQVEQIFESTKKPEQLLKILTILVSRGVTCKPVLEGRVLEVVGCPSLDLSDRIGLVEKLLGCAPAVVSAGTEASAVCQLLSCDTSSRTCHLLAAFVKNRPHLSLRHIPFVSAAVRQHLLYMERCPDNEEIQNIPAALLQLVATFKRKKEDWGNVAAYLLADVLNTNLAVKSNAVKQTLMGVVNLLLDVCEGHSHEYLSANLSPEANEIFKVVLKDYKVNHKFTGKNI